MKSPTIGQPAPIAQSAKLVMASASCGFGRSADIESPHADGAAPVPCPGFEPDARMATANGVA
jgi:hypothetical protein